MIFVPSINYLWPSEYCALDKQQTRMVVETKHCGRIGGPHTTVYTTAVDYCIAVNKSDELVKKIMLLRHIHSEVK